jgi:hypothetical protein
MHIEFWRESQKERDYQEDPIISWRIMLTWSFEKQDGWYELDSSGSG